MRLTWSNIGIKEQDITLSQFISMLPAHVAHVAMHYKYGVCVTDNIGIKYALHITTQASAKRVSNLINKLF